MRALIENGWVAQEGAVHRLWYAGPMFRHERPQKGRYRQFHQIGVEAFGMPGPDVDAEQIVLCARLWEALGITGSVTLQVNSLGTPASRAVHRERLVAYFTRHAADLDEDSRRRLETNPLRILDSKNPALAEVIAGAPSLPDSLDAASRTHFEDLCRLLEAAGVRYVHNPRLVRGLDYTHTVFEWITDRLGAQDAVCSGGRYDGLVSRLGGQETPAVGFALGMERVIALLEQAGHIPPSSAPTAIWSGPATVSTSRHSGWRRTCAASRVCGSCSTAAVAASRRSSSGPIAVAPGLPSFWVSRNGRHGRCRSNRCARISRNGPCP